MKTFTVRLKPGQDLRDELEALVKTHHIEAGIVLTCVGSLSRATLRLADENLTKVWDEKFEIVSLTGTLSPEGIHAHISLSDKTGRTIGGHLKRGCTIHTTAEIAVGMLEGKFERKFDEETGFEELVVSG
jgi:uncharacterized protein